MVTIKTDCLCINQMYNIIKTVRGFVNFSFIEFDGQGNYWITLYMPEGSEHIELKICELGGKVANKEKVGEGKLTRWTVHFHEAGLKI